jgi:hypothetical protein
MVKNKYKVPLCDCGGELSIWKESINYKVIKINKNGTESKRVSVSEGEDCHEKLICANCHKYYNYDTDSKDRIIKGEEQ